MNNISDHITETVNTLYFGYNAMQCKTTKRLDTGPIDYKAHYIRLQAAYKILEQVISRFRGHAVLCRHAWPSAV